MSELRLENITYFHGKDTPYQIKALDNVSLSVPTGKVTGLIGHTGSGKSTLVQMFNGLLKPEDGRVIIDGVDIWEKPKEIRKVRFKVGLVMQFPEYQLFAETVFEDIAFGYKNFYPESQPEEIKKAVFGVMALVGLPFNIANKSPIDLSGGQKRRVAIAGVLVTKPEVLVLDEPVAGLDPIGKSELMRILHGLHTSGMVKTIVIVSHDMDEVCENCTDIAVFSNGEIVYKGTPKEVFSRTEELKSLRLDVPVTGYLTDALNSVGVKIQSDFTRDDFVNQLVNYYKKVE